MPPVSLTPTMAKFMLTALPLILAAVLINGWMIILSRDARPAPVEVIASKALTRQVPYRGTFTYSLTVRINRDDCTRFYEYRFVGQAGEQAGDVKTAPNVRIRGGKFRSGESTREFDIVLPASIRPGRWLAEPRGWALCSRDPRPWPILHPPMKFTVIE